MGIQNNQGRGPESSFLAHSVHCMIHVLYTKLWLPKQVRSSLSPYQLLFTALWNKTTCKLLPVLFKFAEIKNSQLQHLREILVCSIAAFLPRQVISIDELFDAILDRSWFWFEYWITEFAHLHYQPLMF